MSFSNKGTESFDDIDNLVGELDETFVPLPGIDFEPHILISKVRKHYMEYIVNLLNNNLQVNQHFAIKDSATTIWRCAKNIEMKAAQTCMVVQLYRKYFVTVINEVKSDTKKGKIFNKLYECLSDGYNEKETQTSIKRDCKCQCYCHDNKKRRKVSLPSNRRPLSPRIKQEAAILSEKKHWNNNTLKRIPVITNMTTNVQPALDPMMELPRSGEIRPAVTDSKKLKDIKKPIEQHPDDIMLQMEKMFQCDQTEDDIFESTLFATSLLPSENSINNSVTVEENNKISDSIIENHAAQIKILDEKLSTLTGLLKSNEPQSTIQKPQMVQKKSKVSKWHCEEYFMKKNLFELLYQIGDTNRKKLIRIKELYMDLFGPDSDDEEGIMSPDESQEMIDSCKSRIDVWVTAVLAPCYLNGRIKGKLLYKAVAKHLIELIYKCKPYPSEFEVTSFVLDFLENHNNIRCEADFKEFKIENVHRAPNYSIV